MMDMNALILTTDVAVHAIGQVEDPPDLAAFLDELRRLLLHSAPSDRQRLYELLLVILRE